MRRIQLKGAYNCRDIGGYPTSQGETTVWRKLFRSDDLAKLTNDDLEQINKMNIQLLIDLRSEEERAARPNRLPKGHGARIVNINIYASTKSHNTRKREIFNGNLGQKDLGKELRDAYKRSILNYQHEFRHFFKLLLNAENYPALVLCNAGKDRTGVVIAIVLLALGVSRQDVIQDYMLSKIYLQPMVNRMVARIRWLSLFRADIAQLKKLLDTRIDYLEETFKAIDQNFGSLEFFLKAIGMDGEKRQLLRSLLCA